MRLAAPFRSEALLGRCGFGNRVRQVGLDQCEELPGAGLPGVAFGELPVASAIDLQSPGEGGRQVFVHPAVAADFDHIERALHRVGGDGYAAGRGGYRI